MAACILAHAISDYAPSTVDAAPAAIPPGGLAGLPQPNPIECASGTDLPTNGCKSHHASHLILGANGQPVCFWFAGLREGSEDIRILRSEWEGGAWTPPTVALDAPRVSQMTRRYVRKLGNPVAWRDAKGKLHLFVVTVTLGGWSGSRIAHFVSDDDGRSFGVGEIIPLSPFLNFSTLVKSAPVTRAGSAFFPVYHEFIIKRPLMVVLDAEGTCEAVHRMGHKTALLQPVVALMPDGSFTSGLRSYHKGALYTQNSPDGENWTEAIDSGLPNPNSAIAMANLPDGRVIFAFNDSPSNRKSISFAVQERSGKWRRTGYKINGLQELSYPSLLATAAGLHVTYTNERTRISHAMIPYGVLLNSAPVLTADGTP